MLEAASRVGDQALLACLKIIVAVRRSADIVASEEARLLHQSGLLHGHRLWLEFGMHVGWAVEGAIGSHAKVDACYMSPHVDLAARLQRLTSSYGTQLLMSGSFYKLLSHNVRGLCRKVDSILLPPSQTALVNAAAAAAPDADHDAAAGVEATHNDATSAAAAHAVPMSLYTFDTFDWPAAVPQPLVRGDLLSVGADGSKAASSRIIATRVLSRGGAGGAGGGGGGAGGGGDASGGGGGGGTPGASGDGGGTVPSACVGIPTLAALGTCRILDADVFNGDRAPMPDRERCISLLGEADIIEHPVVVGSFRDTLFDDDPQLAALRLIYTTPEFRSHQEDAMEAYVHGDWPAARSHFTAAVGALLAAGGTRPAPGANPVTADAPSAAVWRYMEAHDFVAPPWWQGRRPWADSAEVQARARRE